jgi:ring-1,2-phenylacetyl-CoA epoxidase subunit PaaD
VVNALAPISADQVYAWLQEVPDPEIPVLSVVDLGVVREVSWDGDACVVVITPTYSGCPAMRVIEDEIVGALERHGVADVRVRTVYSPAWTTDWMTERAKAKLEAYGIAPPGRPDSSDLVTLRRSPRVVRCPYCKSLDTKLQSEFGPTACKAIYTCSACRQPFELFKPL